MITRLFPNNRYTRHRFNRLFVRLNAVAGKLRLLRSGHLNFYLGSIGLLLLLVLGLTPA